MAKTHTSWKAGQSGNLKGRPLKKDSITHLMNEFLKKKPKGQKVTYKEIFIKKAFKKAIDGDIPAMKLIWNYIDGLPTQNVNLGGQGDNPILTKDLTKKEFAEIKSLIENTDFENEEE